MTKARDIARAGTALSSVDATELGYLDGVTSNVQTQLNAKLASSTAATTYQAINTNVSTTELGYLDGVTSAIQTQLNQKPEYVAGKNAVINGGFDIWQRGTSYSMTNSWSYGAPDRWGFQQYPTGGACTVTRSTDVPTGFQYSLKTQRTASSTNTSSMGILHCIESVNAIPLQGKTVTLSFYAKAGANFSGGTLNAKIQTGTSADEVLSLANGSYTGNIVASNISPTITTSWVRYTSTVTLASNLQEISININWAGSGTAGADDSVYIAGVQLEVGSAATPFSRNASTLQGELDACQRYFFKVGGEISGQHTIRQGGYYDANYIGFYCPYPVPMRVAPSITAYGNPQVYQSGTAYSSFTWNNTIAGNPSTQNQYIVGTKTSHGLTVNLSCDLYCATTSDYIGVSAEL